MVADLRAQGYSHRLHHALHGRGRAALRSIAIIDHGRMIAQGSQTELVAQSFGSRSDVLMRFASTVENAATWAAAHGGTLEEGAAHFAVEKPTDIGLLGQTPGWRK